MPSTSAPDTVWTRLRAVLNWVNLSTPLGLVVARAGGAVPERHERGTWLAGGYRWSVPVASAFTVGNVVCSRHDADWLRARPSLLAHEDRHCTQYAACLGPVMVPLYLASAGVSWVVAGDHSSYNPFERLAGLAAGGYPSPRTPRWRRRG
ncbi:hypothetical protein [Solicola sp. PLA-1-18]|uniref:hypothetical protein n=1 Tax=Solicola sp. PLA-1-18 TaxID=3380532 RepID=UPI003B790A6B